MNTIIIVMIALFTSVTAPLILAIITARQHRVDREADWKRQDRLAAQAAEAATLQLEHNSKSDAKLDKIHTLVDGAMTAAMRSELAAVRRELYVLRELAVMHRESGQEPAREEAEIKATEAKVKELAETLRLREQAFRRSEGR